MWSNPPQLEVRDDLPEDRLAPGLSERHLVYLSFGWVANDDFLLCEELEGLRYGSDAGADRSTGGSLAFSLFSSPLFLFSLSGMNPADLALPQSLGIVLYDFAVLCGFIGGKVLR